MTDMGNIGMYNILHYHRFALQVMTSSTASDDEASESQAISEKLNLLSTRAATAIEGRTAVLLSAGSYLVTASNWTKIF